MASQNSLLELSDRLAGAVEIGEKAVAAVYGRPHVPSSGVLWRPGIVVTTDHTLKRDEDVTVTLADGRNVPATVAGRDESTDLAVLRAASESAAAIAPDSSVRTGSIVLALGRRTGNGISASFGIVSAAGGAWRTWRGGQIDRFLRPDVSIYTGFSGGALIDAEGRVIGVNTSGLTRGTAVTIPASTVSKIVDELLANGGVRRGFLGIGMHPVELPGGGEGLVILSLEPNGPAAKAGIVVGDVLLTLNGEAVTETDAVQAHLGAGSVGKPVAAGILRGGVPQTIEIVPAERPGRR
ncbi:MAG TPA: trypsin-like peptidase domain-containing protein [Bryobacteraceae bacterium]|nr:trypsin-like peptidase domain-containing protein [Bryobacteraceae bacterium]